MKLFSLLSLGLLLLAGGASAQYANIIEAAQAAGLTTLAAAVDAADLTDFLSNGTRALTVFAPTNEAFTNALDALGITQEDLLSSTALLTEVLRLHVLDDRIASADIAAGSTNLPTLAGGAETQFGLIVTNDGGVTVESYGSTANVTTPDVTAGDSVVHVIDAVLLPFYLNVAQAAQKNGLSALVDAVVAAGLADALSNSSFVGTVFAPTNEAFQLDAESLANISVPTLQRILQYHIIPGQVLYAADITNNTQYTTLEGSPITTELRAGAVGIMANGGASQVETTDIPVAAGRAVVHTIANVLLPSYPSITQAVTARNLSDLATAATAAGLGDVLANTATELTVFAPTNEAFASALSALGLTLDQLADNTQLLTQVLSDHIIAGPGVLSSALSDGQVLQTLGNTTLEVIKNDTGVFIVAPNNGTVVQVITPDVGVAQDRSVVHIVNGVLVDGTLLSPNSTVGPSPSSGPTSAPGTVPAPPPPPGSATSSSWAPMLIAALLAVATWAMH